MKIFRDLASSLVGIAALLAFASAALAQVVSREQDIADLRLGQRILRRRIVSRRPDQGSFGCADDDERYRPGAQMHSAFGHQKAIAAAAELFQLKIRARIS